MTPRLSVQDVIISFGDTMVLADVGVDVSAGECVGVIGPNGAGKTTLTNAISGLCKLDRGEIHLDGRDITSERASERARLGIGRTFQVPRLFWRLSLIENLMVVAQRRFPRRRGDLRTACWNALEITGMTEVADRRPTTLTNGERRFGELARALMLGGRVLLLDEPATGLREHEIWQLAQVIKSVTQQMDVAVYLVSHDMGLVDAACQSVVALDRGVVIARGTPDEVKRNEAVVGAYLGKEGSDDD